MTDEYRRTDSGSELVDIIHQVRRRWRIKLALRGAVGVLGLGVLALLLSASGSSRCASPRLDHRVPRHCRLGARWLRYLLVRPLLRRVTDEQVALYLEEHEPSLQAAIISAVEAQRPATAGNRRIRQRSCGGWSNGDREVRSDRGRPPRRAGAAAAL